MKGFIVSVTVTVAMLFAGCAATYGTEASDIKWGQAFGSTAIFLVKKAGAEIRRGVTDAEQIKENIAKKHPASLEPLQGYYVGFADMEGAAFVLICDAAGRIKYVEDSDCTDVVDYRYRGGEYEACRFSERDAYCK